MARSRDPYRPFDDALALMPLESGNAINGLGETALRRPTPIFWHRPEREKHGTLQTYIVERFQQLPDLLEIWGPKGDRGPREKDLPPPAPTRIERSAEEWTRLVKDYALAHEADLVGIAAFDPRWTFEGYPVPKEPWLIVLGMAMDHPRLAQAPATDANPTSAAEVGLQYNRGSRASKALAMHIRALGYSAEPHPGPMAKSVSMVPAALACGFGELGKHGSIINRQLGSSFRLSSVLTDLPLVADRLDTFGADDFCLRCKVCSDACPPDAIHNEKQMVRGVERWYVDFDKCIPYFAETYGCGICIAVCPWSTPGRAPRLAEKWAGRLARRTNGEES